MDSESERQVPPGGYTGLPKLEWRMRRLIDRDKAVPPKPSKKQRRQLDLEERQLSEKQAADAESQKRDQLEAESIERILQLADEVKHATCVSVNSKGNGGTTTTLVNMACVLGWLTRTLIVVVDGNPAEGTCAALLGKDHGATINVQQVSSQLEALRRNARTFIEGARPNRWNVRTVAALSTVAAENNPLLEPDKVRDLIQACQEHFEFVFVDTPNVLTSEAGLAAVRTGDVLVFPANRQTKFSLRQLGTSMQSLRENGLKDKVENSVVVITNLEPEDELDGYRKFMNRTKMDDSVIQTYDQDFQGVFMGVPHDDVIARDDVVDVEAWSQETRQAYYDLIIAWLEQVLKEREHHDSMPVPPELAAQNGHSDNRSMVTTHYPGGES